MSAPPAAHRVYELHLLLQHLDVVVQHAQLRIHLLRGEERGEEERGEEIIGDKEGEERGRGE